MALRGAGGAARLACAALIALLIGACSNTTTFVYNRLNTLLPWYVDEYVSLDRGQAEFVDQRLAPLLAWHRNTELPVYLQLLDRIDAAIARPVTASDVESLATEFEQAWLRIEREALGALLELGATLSDKQIAHFLDELDEKQREREKKYLGRSDEEFREDSEDLMVDNGSDYLGRITRNQRLNMINTSRQLLRSDRVWLAARADFNSRLRALLIPRGPDWQQQVRTLMATRDQQLPEQFEPVFEHNANLYFALIASLLNTRSERQDTYLRARLDKLRSDFRALIAEAAASP